MPADPAPGQWPVQAEPMHQTQLRPDVIERIMLRRGKASIHDVIDPARTALVVIDMQHAFVEPGLPSAVPVAELIVPNINQLAERFRAANSTVVWVYTTFSSATLKDWNTFFGGVYDAAFSQAVVDNLSAGAPGHQLWSQLDIQPDDLRITKDRFSAFLPGHCELESVLRERSIDTVVFTGTLTNVCCESSARDAVMRNFSIIMASDANAALSDADHNASMNALAQTFGDVLSTDEIIARLAQP